MCDAEKDWHERSFLASGAINGCQKSPLDEPEMKFSFFVFKPPATSKVLIKAFLIFFAHNSILLCLSILSLRSYKSILVVSCSNFSEIRQCRMQECPAYQDRAVFRFFFHENSTLLQSKLHYMLKINSFFITKQKISWIYLDIAEFQSFKVSLLLLHVAWILPWGLSRLKSNNTLRV